MDSLPVISLDAFRAGGSTAEAEGVKCAEALIKLGCLVVKDSRVTDDDNARFLDLIEDYFAQDRAALKPDEKPEYGFQVGVTLENTEEPRCRADVDCKAIINALDPAERPLDLTLEHSDPKARFFWRMAKPADHAQRPRLSEYNEQDMPNVVPEAFKDRWADEMESYGEHLRSAVQGVAEMLAVGLGLPQNAIVDAGRYGSHLLAPTATNLAKYGEAGHIFAGFHSDISFLTIHGRSRYPGLNIWARNTGKRIAVSVPPGHLLVQAGMQLEAFTGGLILAGYHEVICNEATIAAIERTKRERPDRPLIRISSTMFYHLNIDYMLQPLKGLRGATVEQEQAAALKYQPMFIGEQVQRELKRVSRRMGIL